jgi:hypothetical protein
MTKTPAKLVEYAQLAAAANSSTPNHIERAFETCGTRAGPCDFADCDRNPFFFAAKVISVQN